MPGAREPLGSSDSASPDEWLARAKSSLLVARQPKPEGAYWEDLCFLAAQAAEKALKAVLISRGIPFTEAHTIGMATDLLPEDLELPGEVREAAKLNDFVAIMENPGDYPPVSADEYREAIRLAQAVVSWAEEVLAERGAEGSPTDSG
jgi:HEPN domain-containing protein